MGKPHWLISFIRSCSPVLIIAVSMWLGRVDDVVTPFAFAFDSMRPFSWRLVGSPDLPLQYGERGEEWDRVISYGSVLPTEAKSTRLRWIRVAAIDKVTIEGGKNICNSKER